MDCFRPRVACPTIAIKLGVHGAREQKTIDELSEPGEAAEVPEFATVQDAEVWARAKLSIAQCEFADATVSTVRVVCSGLALASLSSRILPHAVYIRARDFPDRSLEVARLNPAMRGWLYVNPAHEYWTGGLSDIAAFAQRLHVTRFWSTSDPRHPILHELGHLAHYGAFAASWHDDWGDRGASAPAQRAIADRVSERARHSPAEFIAEVFAALRLGRMFDAEVMDLFG